MSIKPMAFIDDAGLYALQHNASAKVWSVPAEKETPLFAIPDTHRVVPVELLRKAMSEDLSIPGLYDEMRAIIEDKP